MVSTGIDFERIFARVDPEKRSEAVSKYNERRFYQAALFYGCTVVTYIASKIAYRGVVRRRYVPNFYQHNHVPPKFSFYRDALSAVTHASLLAVSSMSMFITGSLWYCDISSASEFSYKMKKFLGGAEAEAKLSEVPVDQETLDVQNALGDMINGSYDAEENNEEKK